MTLLERARALLAVAVRRSTKMEPLSVRLRERLVEEVGRIGARAVGVALGTTPDTLHRALSGIPIHHGTQAMLEIRYDAPDLAAFAVAVAEALPKLRREHDRDCNALRPPHPNFPDPCTCAAAAHNAILDELAARLGVTG